VLLTSGSITASIDRLERDGLVQRAVASGDRRSRIVHLTVPGEELIRTRFAAHERDMESPFEALSAAELRTLIRLLAKLRPGRDELAA
jgi:DNA-binding MarR family transcriptional regulator